jgi:hypothetical protein
MLIAKKVAVKVGEDSWSNPPGPPAELTGLAASSPVEVDVAMVLLFVGMMTRPPTCYGFSLADLWAWLRYLPALATAEPLRLCDAWTSLDPHHKSILSDDLGVGFSTWILHRYLGLKGFADAPWVIRVLAPEELKLKSWAKHGQSKSPDYISYDKADRFGVLECKGTQSSRGALRSALKRGVGQKKNVEALPGTELAPSLVAGLFVPQWDKGGTALFEVWDPDRRDVERVLRRFAPQEIGRSVMQVALAKELATVGLARTANTLVGSVGAKRDIREVIRDDLRSRSRSVSSANDDVLPTTLEHRWVEPAQITPTVSVRGVRVVVEFSQNELDRLSEHKRPEAIGEEQWERRRAVVAEPQVLDDTVRFTSIFGTRYSLSLLSA